MTRYVDRALRLWWLWLLPILLTPLVTVAIIKLRPVEYDVQTVIWAERLTYFATSDENRWTTQAQIQANLLGELLQTRTFVMHIAKATNLIGPTPSERDQELMEEYFRKRLRVTVRGAQSLEITFATSEPALGVAVLQALIEGFQDTMARSLQEQASLAIEFYSRQLPEREKELLAADAGVRDFLANDVRSGIDLPTSERLLEQSRLSDLRRQQEIARKRYDDTVSRLEQVQMQAAARATAQQTGFRVLDPPSAPAEPVNLRRALLLPVGGVLALTLGLALAATLVPTWLDRTMRTAADIERLTDLPALGTIPRYRRRQKAATLTVPRERTVEPDLVSAAPHRP